MAFRAGHNAWIKMDGVAGSGVDISQYADQVTLPQPVAMHEVSSFGSSSRRYVPGLTDGGEIGMSGPLDVALGTFIAAVKAAQAAGSATSTFDLGPAGSVSGLLRQTAEVYVSAYDTSVGVDGRVEYSCSLQIDGAPDNTTF